MTREIKFRAWDGTQMHPAVHEDFVLSSIVKEGGILMQYTGLKDKNGKEIYEGDIVKYSAHYFGDNLEKQCIEVVVWDVEEACYPWKLTSTEFSGGPEWREIIGNIHENPEIVP